MDTKYYHVVFKTIFSCCFSLSPFGKMDTLWEATMALWNSQTKYDWFIAGNSLELNDEFSSHVRGHLRVYHWISHQPIVNPLSKPNSIQTLVNLWFTNHYQFIMNHSKPLINPLLSPNNLLGSIIPLSPLTNHQDEPILDPLWTPANHPMISITLSAPHPASTLRGIRQQAFGLGTLTLTSGSRHGESPRWCLGASPKWMVFFFPRKMP